MAYSLTQHSGTNAFMGNKRNVTAIYAPDMVDTDGIFQASSYAVPCMIQLNGTPEDGFYWLREYVSTSRIRLQNLDGSPCAFSTDTTGWTQGVGTYFSKETVQKHGAGISDFPSTDQIDFAASSLIDSDVQPGDYIAVQSGTNLGTYEIAEILGPKSLRITGNYLTIVTESVGGFIFNKKYQLTLNGVETIDPEWMYQNLNPLVDGIVKRKRIVGSAGTTYLYLTRWISHIDWINNVGGEAGVLEVKDCIWIHENGEKELPFVITGGGGATYELWLGAINGAVEDITNAGIVAGVASLPSPMRYRLYGSMLWQNTNNFTISTGASTLAASNIRTAGTGLSTFNMTSANIHNLNVIGTAAPPWWQNTATRLEQIHLGRSDGQGLIIFTDLNLDGVRIGTSPTFAPYKVAVSSTATFRNPADAYDLSELVEQWVGIEGFANVKYSWRPRLLMCVGGHRYPASPYIIPLEGCTISVTAFGDQGTFLPEVIFQTTDSNGQINGGSPYYLTRQQFGHLANKSTIETFQHLITFIGPNNRPTYWVVEIDRPFDGDLYVEMRRPDLEGQIEQ